MRPMRARLVSRGQSRKEAASKKEEKTEAGKTEKAGVGGLKRQIMTCLV